MTSPRAALVLGIAAVVSMVVAVPFLILDGFGIWLGLIPFGIVGAVIARRQPGNPVGVDPAAADVRDRGFGRRRAVRRRSTTGEVITACRSPGWRSFWRRGTGCGWSSSCRCRWRSSPTAVSSRRWRRVLWAYLAFCAVFVASNAWQNGERRPRAPHPGRLERPARVERHQGTDTPERRASSFVYLAFGAAWVARLVLSYRGSTGDYRQQLKWLLSGGAVGIGGLSACRLRPAAARRSRPCRRYRLHHRPRSRSRSHSASGSSSTGCTTSTA